MAMPTSDTIALWYHYEEIAMHFNTLIIQFRLQLIGGVGAIGAAAAYLIGGKVEGAAQRAWLRTIVAAGLFVLILVAAMLDLFYYDRLLRGAVDALLDFERNHSEIQMSTLIEKRVGWGREVVWVAYGVMLLILGCFAAWSHGDYRRERKLANQSPAA
jgi:hypothetical protein